MSWDAEILLVDPNARPEKHDLAGWARFYAWEWVDPQDPLESVAWGNGRGQYGRGCQQCTFLQLADEIDRLNALINTPETADFLKGVHLEAAHQRERWPAQHDAGKSPFDWFWLIGFLAQKAAAAAVAGDVEKALHHTISTAAALANWHLAITGVDSSMRPGIEPPAGGCA